MCVVGGACATGAGAPTITYRWSQASRASRAESYRTQAYRRWHSSARYPCHCSSRRDAAPRETYVRVREQARLQLAGRTRGSPVHELLPITPDHGFSRLPTPSPGDVFLDVEGDPFARAGGREYLFGFVSVTPDGTTTARAFWACSDAEERVGFEAVVDEILPRLGRESRDARVPLRTLRARRT